MSIDVIHNKLTKFKSKWITFFFRNVNNNSFTRTLQPSFVFLNLNHLNFLLSSYILIILLQNILSSRKYSCVIKNSSILFYIHSLHLLKDKWESFWKNFSYYCSVSVCLCLINLIESFDFSSLLPLHSFLLF